ncbi:MAG TPA: energy transducer TonB [Epsilonproteobacteria bacterium]|nr:energy transducer TonB [Campylobacterota bacterium]
MEQKVEEKIISFSLSQYIPEVIPAVEEVKEETIEPEPIEPEPVVEEEKIEPIVEESIPEPEVVKVLPKPIVKKVVKPPKKRVKKKKTKKKYVKKRVSKKKFNKKRKTKKATKQKASSSRKFSAAKKNAFLSQIRTRINRNKNYPRIAQRRGMQGTVKVRFTILANGHVSNIVISGKKVFFSSARSAIKKAFPVNVKNAPMSLPETVNLILNYQIR